MSIHSCSHRIVVYYFTKNVQAKEPFFIVNSKEKVMASKMSLSKDLIDVKARNNHRVSLLKPYLFVLLCFRIELHYKLKVCLYLFIYLFTF